MCVQARGVPSIPTPPGLRVAAGRVELTPAFRLDAHSLAYLRAALREEAGAVVVCVEVGADASPPDAAMRKVMREELMDPRRVLAMAFVHAGQSWRSRMVRRVLEGLCRVGLRLPARVFEDAEAARAWLDEARAGGVDVVRARGA